jgi:predicted metal-dependent phosphoesterase TrpH
VSLANLADLHTHTTASDGLDQPFALIQRAIELGLGAIAITDHDTVDAHLILAGIDLGSLTVVPGIEMSANVGDAEVHVLGYFVDSTSPTLSSALRKLREQRIRRIERFCARLTEIGLPISVDQVMRQVTGSVAGRPHIARAMIELGYVTSVGEAFDRYLAGGRPGFVPRDDVTPEFAIGLIHDSRGAAVLAHPFTTGDVERTLDRLTSVGLDGIEVEYGAYDEEARVVLRNLAAARSLIPTGGSDFHGAGHREDLPLASGVVAMDIVAQLAECCRRYQ